MGLIIENTFKNFKYSCIKSDFLKNLLLQFKNVRIVKNRQISILIFLFYKRRYRDCSLNDVICTQYS